MVLTVNDRCTEGIYINLSQRHSEVSRTDHKTHSHCPVYSKIGDPHGSYDRNHLHPLQLSMLLPLTLQTTTQFPANYTQSPLSVVRQAVHRWHCYPSPQLTVSAVLALYCEMLSTKPTSRTKKKWVLAGVHVSVGTP